MQEFFTKIQSLLKASSVFNAHGPIYKIMRAKYNW